MKKGLHVYISEMPSVLDVILYLFDFSSNDGDLITQFVIFDETLAVHRDTTGLDTVHLSGARLDCKERKNT